MDDKTKVSRLYEKMNLINYYMNKLNTNIDYLKSELNNSFLIDNKILEHEKINVSKHKAERIQNSIKYDVMPNLRQYL